VLGGFGKDTLNCGADTDTGDGGPGVDTAGVDSGCETLLNVP
jgi:hypothetical protein